MYQNENTTLPQYTDVENNHQDPNLIETIVFHIDAESDREYAPLRLE